MVEFSDSLLASSLGMGVFLTSPEDGTVAISSEGLAMVMVSTTIVAGMFPWIVAMFLNIPVVVSMMPTTLVTFPGRMKKGSLMVAVSKQVVVMLPRDVSFSLGMVTEFPEPVVTVPKGTGVDILPEVLRLPSVEALWVSLDVVAVLEETLASLDTVPVLFPLVGLSLGLEVVLLPSRARLMFVETTAEGGWEGAENAVVTTEFSALKRLVVLPPEKTAAFSGLEKDISLKVVAEMSPGSETGLAPLVNSSQKLVMSPTLVVQSSGLEAT